MAERGKRTDGALLCEDDQPTNQPTAPNPVRVLDESGYRDRTAVIQTMMMMKSKPKNGVWVVRLGGALRAGTTGAGS